MVRDEETSWWTRGFRRQGKRLAGAEEIQRQVTVQVTKTKQRVCDDVYVGLKKEGEKLVRQRDRDGEDVKEDRVGKDRHHTCDRKKMSGGKERVQRDEGVTVAGRG